MWRGNVLVNALQYRKVEYERVFVYFFQGCSPFVIKWEYHERITNQTYDDGMYYDIHNNDYFNVEVIEGGAFGKYYTVFQIWKIDPPI